MKSRLVVGEVLLTLFFAALGIVWIVVALRMPLGEGFAPQSGFMPLWDGVILTGLAAVILVNLFMQNDGKAEQPIGKALIVLAALFVAIGALEPAGFGPSVFLFLLFLFVVLERLPIAKSA